MTDTIQSAYIGYPIGRHASSGSQASNPFQAGAVRNTHIKDPQELASDEPAFETILAKTATGHNVRHAFQDNESPDGPGALRPPFKESGIVPKNVDPATWFSLAGKGISDAQVADMAHHLMRDTKIKHLILSGNRIGNQGAADIAKLLAHNTSIAWLVLNHNQIEDTGAIQLAKGLESNRTVQHVILNNNQIGDDGLVAIAEALHENPTVKSLFIQDNRIKDRGVLALAEQLNSGQSIAVINIQGHNASESAIGVLRKKAEQLGIRLYA